MMKIRLATEKDLPELGRIYAEAYQVFDVGERWTDESATELLKYWLERRPELSFVAEYEGKLAGGFFADVKPWWDGPHLVDGEIFVRPDLQKHGIGTELSKVMYRTALEKFDAKVFETYTFRKTLFPLEWYRRQGFEEIEEWVMISGDLREVLKKLEKPEE